MTRQMRRLLRRDQVVLDIVARLTHAGDLDGVRHISRMSDDELDLIVLHETGWAA